jgi:hypothetical protein
MATFSEFIKSPKGMALVIGVPVAAGGIAVAYILLSRKTNVTVTVDKPTVNLCQDKYTITATVTDGFGRPIANEPITFRFYIAGTKVGEDYNSMTSADGTCSVTICWQTRTDVPSQHIDTEARYQVTHEVECRGAKGYASNTLVLPVCTNIPCSCPR